MSRGKAIAFGVPVLVLTGIAGQIVTSFKITGDTPGANFWLLCAVQAKAQPPLFFGILICFYFLTSSVSV